MARKKRRDDNEVENPKPRIGRRIPKTERQFSKRFQKKQAKVRKRREGLSERERAKEKAYRQSLGTPLSESAIEEAKRRTGQDIYTIEEAIESGYAGSDVYKEPNLTTIIDKAAIIANVYGIDGAADLLGVDEDLLDYGLRGNRLDRRQIALIQRGYDDAIINELDIDFDKVEAFAEKLKSAIEAVNEERYEGDRLKNLFRYVVAEGKFDIEKGFESINNHPVWESLMDTGKSHKGGGGGTTPAVKRMLLEWMVDEDTSKEAVDTMLEWWRLDLEYLPSADEENIEDSLFWAWFRELFYA